MRCGLVIFPRFCWWALFLGFICSSTFMGYSVVHRCPMWWGMAKYIGIHDANILVQEEFVNFVLEEKLLHERGVTDLVAISSTMHVGYSSNLRNTTSVPQFIHGDSQIHRVTYILVWCSGGRNKNIRCVEEP